MGRGGFPELNDEIFVNDLAWPGLAWDFKGEVFPPNGNHQPVF